ncbi:MAG: thiamine pyrophosphate-binding protein [Proteobacteria bacterium]|nr:thiamine pyrophosphate-binding protein [Pseudomonadota bacterium]
MSENAVSTAQVMARYLKAAGVTHIFGYPGDPNIDFIEAARIEGMKLILGRREGTCGFMAEACGMLGDAPGVCLSTLGPGSTALVNPVANAFLDRVPMVALSGQVASRMEPFFTHQVADHNRLFSPITKWAVRMVPAAVAEIMRKALRIALADRPGPVHITTASDAVKAPAGSTEVRLPPAAPAPQMAQVFANRGGLKDPVKEIAAARRPVLLTGISALRSKATEALKSFAEKAGIPVVVSPMSKGVFPEDHPLYAGTVDMACNKVVWEFLKGADLVLCVGFDPVELIKPWQVSAPAIHIDSTPNTDQIYAADLEIVGHVPSILAALADAYKGEPKWREADLKAHRKALTEVFYSGRVAGVLNPSDVIDAINGAYAGSDAIVTTDVGSHKLLVGQGWKATRPRHFLMTNGLSAMGFSLPAAIAAKLVRRDQPVVCTVGDGGFAMVMGELRLAAAQKLGIVVVVFEDGSLNRIEIKQLLRQIPSELTRIESTDCLKLAESMDCEGAYADNARDLETALARGRNGLDRPLVIQAKISPDQYLAQF